MEKIVTTAPTCGNPPLPGNKVPEESCCVRLSETDVYQQDNLVVDPVCGKRLNKLVAGGQEVVHGQIYYFCMDQCRQKFLEDTSRYAERKVA